MSRTQDFPDPVVLQLIASVGTVKGKKAFQKLMYFINIKVNKYKFKWNRFGPFSEELSYHLDDLIYNKYVTVEKKPVTVEKKQLSTIDGIQYNISISENYKGLLNMFEVDKQTKNVVDGVVKLLGNENPRKLELLASVHYISNWAKEMNKEMSSDDVYELIHKLKPDSGFTPNEVKNSLNFLRQNKLLD